jgi:predicted metal-dependent hydrolase
MNLIEKWPVLRLPALGRPGPMEDERLLRLFWNRAELKKALQGLDDELHSLRNRIKQQEGAHSRLEEQLDQLETLLGNPERGPDALVHFGLRNLWRDCRRQLENFAAELRRQRQDHERKRRLAEFQQDRKERLKLADERMAEARSVLQQEQARLAEGEQRLSAMTALWHFFRRRDLAFELGAQRARVAEARRHLDDMLQSRRTIEQEPWPEFTGLSIQGRRGINLAVIAYAQLLCQRLSRHGLAVQARLATHRRVEDSRFGSRTDCLGRLDQIAEAVETARSQDGVAPEVRTLTERLRQEAAWRRPEDAVPAPSSLQSVAGPGPNVLIDDYWDIYQVLLR